MGEAYTIVLAVSLTIGGAPPSALSPRHRKP